ncbi:NAD(P)H-dependent oxidoreductase [Nocardioides sp. TF02-7]|uniref:NADPH-dependent FMN reductase n=1 Tax=Nocardioides sp. TF02-7 TaxID=2917724 RepID=UPI001F054A1F|nr:NAD(P)H-dependent oxidoreductase [Nocardioides sp. TF02-7]UMG94138.1 NAD(P)H-dependent oxidoreductase [Nocardioides sp. TF02-7]
MNQLEQSIAATPTPTPSPSGPISVGVVAGSTRPTRRSLAIAEWVAEGTHPDLLLEVVDLAEVDLPLLCEPVAAVFGDYEHDHTRRWAQEVRHHDAFILVSPEYNASIPAVLKNALDHLYHEWQDKAVGFVGYGMAGGVRAVEQLRLITAELQMVGVPDALHLSPHQVSHDRFEATEADEHGRAALLRGLARRGLAMAPLRSARAETTGRDDGMNTGPAAMRRVDRQPDLGIADPRTESVIASWWTLEDEAVADRACDSALAAMPAVEGLLRFSVFRAVVGADVFLLSQWASHRARANYLATAAAAARGAVDDELGNVVRDRVLARPTALATDLPIGAALLLVARTPGDGNASVDPATSTFRSDDGTETVALSFAGDATAQGAFAWVGAVEPQAVRPRRAS